MSLQLAAISNGSQIAISLPPTSFKPTTSALCVNALSLLAAVRHLNEKESVQRAKNLVRVYQRANPSSKTANEVLTVLQNAPPLGDTAGDSKRIAVTPLVDSPAEWGPQETPPDPLSSLSGTFLHSVNSLPPRQHHSPQTLPV